MKAVVLLAIIAVAYAVPQGTVISRSEFRDDAGQFSLSFTTSDGVQHVERGVLEPNNEGDGHVLVKEGWTKYTSPEGENVYVKWNANKNGYNVVEGTHIPRPVEPVPPTF